MSVFNVVCVILVILIEVITGEECAKGWIGHGNKCYHFSSSNKTQRDAIAACYDEGAILAVIPNRNVNDFLILHRGTHSHWIGLLISDNKLTWYWNDGTLLETTDTFKWERYTPISKEPTGDSTCARIAETGELRDYFCHDPYYYICESDVKKDLPWKIHNNHWYFFSEAESTNYVAASYCFNNNAYLARVTEEDEIDFVSRNRVASRDYWIGLSRRYWTDGSAYIWHNFQSNMTDDITKHDNCFILQGTDNKWAVELCSKLNRYICQKDMQLPSSTETVTTSATSTGITTASSATVTTTNSTEAKTHITTGNTNPLSSSTMRPPVTSHDLITEETSYQVSIRMSTVKKDITTMFDNASRLPIHDTKQKVNSVLVYVMSVIFFLDVMMSVVVLVLGLHLRNLKKSHKENPSGKSKEQETFDSYDSLDSGQLHEYTNDTYEAIVTPEGVSVYENVDSAKYKT